MAPAEENGTDVQVPSWVYVILLGGAVFVATLSVPLWRRATWGNLWRFLRWVFAIRPITAKKRSELVASGYSKRQHEFDETRKKAKQPSWNFRSEDHLPGDKALHWLRNRGYPAYDVGVTTDDSEFVLDGEVFFPGPIETNIGKNFRGAPTEKGLQDGVTFHVTWYDQHGLDHKRDVFAPPEELWGSQIRAVELSHEKALQAKDDEIGDLNAEITKMQAFRDNTTQQGKEMIDKILSGPPKPPLPQPRWLIAPAASGKDNEYVLRNSVPRSVAVEVRLEPESEFNIIDAGHWADLSGTQTEGVWGNFVGVFTPQGKTFGVHITVWWYDEHGKRQSCPLFLRGPGQTSTIVPPLRI